MYMCIHVYAPQSCSEPLDLFLSIELVQSGRRVGKEGVPPVLIVSGEVRLLPGLAKRRPKNTGSWRTPGAMDSYPRALM